MRWIVLAALVSSAAAAGGHVIGHVRHGDQEIEVYNTQSWCPSWAGQAASIYPAGNRSKYTQACWHPLDKDRFSVTIKDGDTIIIERRRLVPVVKGPKADL